MTEKILVVDDDLETLRLVGLMLQRQGYEIAAASSGHQALIMAQDKSPDLILLDIMMPDMDGVEVTRRLRSRPSTKDIPIIMFTAKTQVEDKILGYDAGADDYLTKPTQPRELFAHIKAVLARAQKPKTAALNVASPKQTTEKGTITGVMSVRGGLGVSTLALNLAIMLHHEYKTDVVLAEYRPGNGVIGLELGLQRIEGLNRLLQLAPAAIDETAVETGLITHATGIRLLLASPLPCDAKYACEAAQFEAITHQLKFLSKHTIIDLGSSLTPAVEKVLAMCDDVLVIVEPVPQTIVQTKALLEDLLNRGFGDGRAHPVLVNRIRSGMQLSWSQVQDQLGSGISYIFTPAPELAYQASINNLPMILQQPDSLTTQQFKKLAEMIAQRNIRK